MPRQIVRSAALYLALVGFPLLGLSWILAVGRRLEAPISVGGAWRLEQTIAADTTSSCLGVDFGDQRPTLTIHQSGTRAELVFNDAGRTTLGGVLEGDSLFASGRSAGRSSSTCPTSTVELRAGVATGGPVGGTLTGVVRREGCGCADQAIIASRPARQGS